VPARTAPADPPAAAPDLQAATERCAELVRTVVRSGAASAEACRAAARARHRFVRALYLYKLAVQARRAARRRIAELRRETAAAHSDCRAALRAAYRAWQAAHPGATSADHERFFAEIGEAAGVSGRQVARMAGYSVLRTEEEVWEDYRLHLAGWSVREIARYRGKHPQAIQKTIVRCSVLEKLDGPGCGRQNPATQGRRLP
jgi:hypothetical protein